MRRGLDRRGEPFGIEEIRLVPDFDDPVGVFRVDAEVVQDRDDVGTLRQRVLMGNIAHVQDHIGRHHFFERCPERRDQHRRQIGDEPHGVGEDRPAPMRQSQDAQRGIERCENHVVGQHGRPGQPVEQRGLARIGVADEGHRRERDVDARLAVGRTGLLHVIEIALDPGHPFLDQAAIGLDLRLSGSAQEPEAAALPLQMGPGAHQPGFLVFEMRELNLKCALSCPGAPPEDLEDQAGAIDDLATERRLEIALLHRRERAIHDHERDFEIFDEFGQFRHLALAQEGRRPNGAEVNDDASAHVEIDGLPQRRRFFDTSLGTPSGASPGVCSSARIGPDHQRPRGLGRGSFIGVDRVV